MSRKFGSLTKPLRPSLKGGENAYARELRKSLNRERLITKLIDVMTQATEPQGIFNAMSRELCEFFQSDRCVIVEYAEDGRENGRVNPKLRIASQFCRDDGICPINMEDLPPFEVPLMPSRGDGPHPSLFCHYSSPAQFPPGETGDFLRSYGIRSLVVYEIFHLEEPYGRLILEQFERDRTWSDEELELIETIVNQVGAALYQAKLYHMERKALREREASNALLAAISRVQSNYITNSDPWLLFDEFLKDILALTQSVFGFIGEVLYDAAGRPYLKFRALTNISWNEETRKLYEQYNSVGLEFHNVHTLFGVTLLTGQKIISNDPTNDPRRGGIPPGHPPLTAFMGLPVYRRESMVGMIGLANRPGGYDDALANFLQPLVVTCGNIVDAYRNATLRKQAEEELRQSEARFRRVVESGMVGILFWRMDGSVTEANQALLDIVGYTREELFAGKLNWIELTPPEFHELDLEMTRKVTAEGKVTSYEKQYFHKDGHRIDILIACAIMEDPNEDAPCFVMDITERKRTEKALRESEAENRKLSEELERRVVERTAQLEAVNKELESFSYSVSHDLRAPLRSIDGFSQALFEDYGDKLDDVGKNCINRVRANARRMGQLIDDMLSLSRYSRRELRRENVDFSRIAHELVRELREQEPDRQVNFRVQEGLVGQGDPVLLQVVLQNLIGNAWKFTAKKPCANIEVGMLVNQGRNIYYVKDNGAGFDMTYVGKLFGAFQRLHGMNEFKGTGIGLATVQRIIHRHGGQVWAEGAVGEGATFYFTLCSGPGKETTL